MPASNFFKLNLLLFAFLLQGCINVRVVAKYDSDNIVKNDTTVVSWFWGIKQPRDLPSRCESKSICSVTSKHNAKTILVAALTLGIVVPVHLVWECCPADPGDEILR